MKNVPKPAIPPAPETVAPCLQYDLFTSFFGDAAELSNTIELWDAIPKYAVSPRQQQALRGPDRRLPVYEHRFHYNARRQGQRIQHACRVAIQPASIKTADGYMDFYPSTDEELVEEVIRKIFADQHHGAHDPGDMASWVRFSVQMIRKELRVRGKTRSLTEIKRSIEILSKAHLSLYLDGSDAAIYANPILSDVFRVTRKQYLEDSSLAWVARLPALISKSVNELSYRQFNYGVLMSLSSPLCRWLHKCLSRTYINASHLDPYQVYFSTLQRDSGLLTYSRTHDNLRALETAFGELVQKKVILNWERTDERRAGRKILDIRYRLLAHPQFIADMKAANARLKDSRLQLQVVGGSRQPGRPGPQPLVGRSRNKP